MLFDLDISVKTNCTCSLFSYLNSSWQKEDTTLLIHYVTKGNLDSWVFVHRLSIVIINLFYFNELDTFHNIHFTFYSQSTASNIIKANIYGKISKSLKPKILDLITVTHIWGLGSVVKSTCYFCRGPRVRFSAPSWYLTTLCNFSLRGTNTLFWSLW